MQAPSWLLVIGILIGLITRSIVGGKAYGIVTEALLGITGAFAVDWVLAEKFWADRRAAYKSVGHNRKL